MTILIALILSILPAPAPGIVDIYDKQGNTMRVTTECAAHIESTRLSFPELIRTATATPEYLAAC